MKNYRILFCHKDVALEVVYKVVLSSRIVRPHRRLVTESAEVATSGHQYIITKSRLVFPYLYLIPTVIIMVQIGQEGQWAAVMVI